MVSPQVSGFTVRPITLADAASWAGYVCLPEVRQHTSSTATTVEEIEAEIERTLAQAPNTPIRFVLLPEGSTTIVATVGFHTISAMFGTAEVTYDVAPSHWGNGIATAACRSATLWGFQVKAWHRVQATTVLANTRSQRVLERCGFKREGLLRNFRLVRGEPTDYWLYSAIPGDVAGAA